MGPSIFLWIAVTVLGLWGAEVLLTKVDEEGNAEINLGFVRIEVLKKPPSGNMLDLIPSWWVLRVAGVLVLVACLKLIWQSAS